MKFSIFSINHQGIGRILLPALVFALCLIGFTDAGAQTTRRTRSSVPQPVGTPVPPSTLTIPEIVRRADEVDVENPNAVTDTGRTAVETENAEVLRNRIAELTAQLKSLESGTKSDADAKEKKLLMSLDILTRAEQRSESLRRQLYEVIEKENAVRSKIEQLTYDMRPEMIDRSISMTGSLRPEDLRDARRKSLESERANLESLLVQIQGNRSKLEQSVERADLLVEKIRLKFEKEIDDALVDEDDPQP